MDPEPQDAFPNRTHFHLNRGFKTLYEKRGGDDRDRGILKHMIEIEQKSRKHTRYRTGSR